MIDTKQMAKYIFEEYANCYSEVDIEELAKHLDEIKSEAIKEFAKRLKAKLHLDGVVMGFNCAFVEDEALLGIECP